MTQSHLASRRPAKCFSLSLLFGMLLAPLAVFAQKNITKSVFFDTDKSEMKTESQETLRQLVAELAALPDFDLNIEAYTDDQGTAEYNRALAQRRANAVRDALLLLGCQARSVSVVAQGKQALAKGKPVEAARRQQRRVDVTARPNRIETLRELEQKLTQHNTQFFRLKTSEPTLLSAANGLTVTVPPDAFVLPDGTAPKGQVTLEIREATAPADWLIHRLSTMTDEGALLQSGGMFYLGAQADGRSLQIKKGASLQINLPARGGQNDPEMQIFYGKQAGHGPVTWALPTASVSTADYRVDQNQRSQQHTDSLVRALLLRAVVPVWQPKLPWFDVRQLALARSKPPKPPTLAQPVAPITPDFASQPIRSLSPEQRANLSRHTALQSTYQSATRRYKEAWTKYYRDSTQRTQAVAYRQRCCTRLLAYEDSLFCSIVQQAWNINLKPDRRLEAGINHLGYAASERGVPLNWWFDYFASNPYACWRCTVRRNICRRQLGLEQVPPYLQRQMTGYENERTMLIFKKKVSVYNYAIAPFHQKERDERFLPLGQRLLATLRAQSGLMAAADSLSKELVLANPNDLKQLQSYTISVSNLGWINVDKLMKYPEEGRKPLMIAGSAGEEMFVVCSELNSALPMRYSGGQHRSPNLPAGWAVKLVALKVENGQPMLCVLPMVIGQAAQPAALTYEPVSVRDLRMVLLEKV